MLPPRRGAKVTKPQFSEKWAIQVRKSSRTIRECEHPEIHIVRTQTEPLDCHLKKKSQGELGHQNISMVNVRQQSLP
jgi:hypothetical protein